MKNNKKVKKCDKMKQSITPNVQKKNETEQQLKASQLFQENKDIYAGRRVMSEEELNILNEYPRVHD